MRASPNQFFGREEEAVEQEPIFVPDSQSDFPHRRAFVSARMDHIGGRLQNEGDPRAAVTPLRGYGHLRHGPAFSLFRPGWSCGSQLGQKFGSLADLSEPGKDLLHTVGMGFGIKVRHGILDQHHVIAVLVGIPGRRFNADAGGDPAKNNLRDALGLQIVMERRFMEGAPSDALSRHGRPVAVPVRK